MNGSGVFAVLLELLCLALQSSGTDLVCMWVYISLCIRLENLWIFQLVKYFYIDFDCLNTRFNLDSKQTKNIRCKLNG